ncbi:DUF4292 domain-containing protein [Fulvivirga lutea]|uniref:DUF4292 domain-containing protein n=1 Tax=Fulvivirga lutea TaxID=2810512 RepID=A0A974WJU9_9BACT|nr:DUF4292 domain-containing protein [Fulvivirga lutea]QSE97490.1 DUF4292 domain-containing protein [Fulvivirga lutea]
MKNKIAAFPCLLIAIILGSGCSNKFQGVTWNLLDKNKLDVREIDFEYFSGKAKINYKDEELDIKARANVRIKKDSAIWIAFSAVGIQGARCMISQDSITILNLVKKEYYVFNYDSLSKQFNFDVNFDAIQSVALGNLIKPYTKGDHSERVDDFYQLKQKSGKVEMTNFVSAETMKIERVEMLEPSSKNTAVIRYYDFQLVEEHAFPYSAIISLFYKANTGTLNTVIEFEYNKAEIEHKPLKFPFSIPKKYERK